MTSGNGSNSQLRPVWKLALFVSLPVWLYLIVDTIVYLNKLWVLTTPFVHLPGYLLWIVLRPSWEGVHDPSFTLICVFNCLFYYLPVFACIAVWRRIRYPGRGNWFGNIKRRKLIVGVLVALAAIVVFALYPYRMNIVPIQVRSLPQPNPTSYVFPGQVETVHEQIYYGFRFGGTNMRMMRFFGSIGFLAAQWRDRTDTVRLRVETSKEPLFGKHVFQDPANKDDLYLYLGNSIASKTYFALGKPLTYRAAYHLHLVPVGEDSIEVTVLTEKPVVMKGTSGLGLHGYMPKWIPVEPTTIEEYTILLGIGHILDVDSMPDLILPDE